MVFLKDFFEKVDLRKIHRRQKKKKKACKINQHARVKNFSKSIELKISVSQLCTHDVSKTLGPVVQSVVSLTSLLRVISLTVLVDSIYNILKYFAEKM